MSKHTMPEDREGIKSGLHGWFAEAMPGDRRVYARSTKEKVFASQEVTATIYARALADAGDVLLIDRLDRDGRIVRVMERL